MIGAGYFFCCKHYVFFSQILHIPFVDRDDPDLPSKRIKFFFMVNIYYLLYDVCSTRVSQGKFVKNLFFFGLLLLRIECSSDRSNLLLFFM